MCSCIHAYSLTSSHSLVLYFDWTTLIQETDNNYLILIFNSFGHVCHLGWGNPQTVQHSGWPSIMNSWIVMSILVASLIRQLSHYGTCLLYLKSTKPYNFPEGLWRTRYPYGYRKDQEIFNLPYIPWHSLWYLLHVSKAIWWSVTMHPVLIGLDERKLQKKVYPL